MGRRDNAPSDELHHVVRFYESDALLTDAAAEFVSAGLKAQEPALLVVTLAGLDDLKQQLMLRGFDVDRALHEGLVIHLDASKTLDAVLSTGVPDRHAFDALVGAPLEQLARRAGHKRVRAFGQMVDLLWKRGNAQAAIRLEELWTELHQRHSFSLFCAYLLGNFYKEDSGHKPAAPSQEIALHQQIEAALRVALKQQRLAQGELQSITDALPVLVAYVDADRRYRFVNRAYEGWLGTPRDQIIGRTLDEALPLELAASIRRHVDTVLAGKMVAFQSETTDRLGMKRYLDVTLVPQRDEDARVQGYVALVSDITLQKQLEGARAQSEVHSERLLKITAAIAQAVTAEQVFEAVVDEASEALQAASAGLWLVPEDSRTTKLVRCRGYSDAQMDRFDAVPLDTPHDFPALDALRHGQPVFIGSRGELVKRYPAVAGSIETRRQYSCCAIPLTAQNRTLGALALTFAEGVVLDDDRRSFVLLVARYSAQALERLRLLEAERQSRERAELLFRLARACINATSLPDIFDAALGTLQQALSAGRSAILLYDADGVMRFRKWRGLSDAYRAEVEGHSPWPRDAVEPQPVVVSDALDDPAWAPYLALFRREGIGALAFIPLVASGRLLGKFMVYYDRPRVLLPHEISVATAIANHVAAATDRFSAVAELKQTVRFNEMFTAILGHDLRNPLGAIMAAAQLMRRRNLNEKNLPALERILNSGGRMARMIDQLLDFTRVRVGQGIPLRPQAVDLDPLVRHVLDELEVASAHGRLSLSAEGDTKGTWDGDRLSQVFSNLAGNALEHGEAQSPVRVHIDGTAADAVRVRVHNQGAVPPEMLPGMFDPVTGGPPRRARSQGLGLGLFITQEIARAHGGSIGVESSETDGTTFTVFLPRESK
jgi:PAS domain S-box-containing protein